MPSLSRDPPLVTLRGAHDPNYSIRRVNSRVIREEKFAIDKGTWKQFLPSLIVFSILARAA